MYYVYVLQSAKDRKLYTGHTDNIERRLAEHNHGKVRSTASRRPFNLIYKKEFCTRSEARWQERYLKSAQGKKKLKNYLNTSLNIPL